MRRKLFLFMFIGILFIIQAKTVFAQTEVSGIISQDTVWDKSGSPYNIIDDTVVDEIVRLKIEEGVAINFTENKKLIVFGKIIAQGSDAAKIIFKGSSQSQFSSYIMLTSLSSENIIEHCVFDRSYINNASSNSIFNSIMFGDKVFYFFNSGSNNTVTNSIFNNIKLNLDGNSNTIDNCIFDGIGDIYSSNNYSIYIYKGAKQNIITNCIIRNNSKDGIWLYDSSTKILNCKIENNKRYGIYDNAFNLFGANTNLLIEKCEIKNNTVGIYISKDSGYSHIFENNISGNQTGVSIGGSSYNQTQTIQKNNIHNNTSYNLVAPIGIGSLNYANNYWGTTVKEEISTKILDFYDDFTRSKVIFEPYLTVPFQRGKILNDGSSTISINDATAGLQYLAGLRNAGFEDGQVNLINMVSILGSDKPTVKDVIALMQYLVGLRDDNFQLVSQS